jgi:hypothetical protein
MKRLLYGEVKVAQILVALALFFMGVAAAAPTYASLSQADREKLRKVAEQLKEAILHEDVDGILRHVSKTNGLTCTDTKIPYQQVRKDLRNKNSHLYMSLFDSVRFSKQCGHEYPAEYPAISDKEFFTKAANESIEIVSIADGWAQVTYKSQTEGLYPREYSFHKEGQDWKLIEGFIVGSCSCG